MGSTRKEKKSRKHGESNEEHSELLLLVYHYKNNIIGIIHIFKNEITNIERG